MQAVGIPAGRPPKLYTAHLSGRDGHGRDGVPIVLGQASAAQPDAGEEEVYWLPKPWASAPPAASPPSEVRRIRMLCHKAHRSCFTLRYALFCKCSR